jgi:membrane protein YdbS with pleckstrin-like domain
MADQPENRHPLEQELEDEERTHQFTRVSTVVLLALAALGPIVLTIMQMATEKYSWWNQSAIYYVPVYCFVVVVLIGFWVVFAPWRYREHLRR